MQRESEAKFKVLHHAELINEALEPYEGRIIYNEEQGFHTDRDIRILSESRNRDRCRVCDGCVIF